MLLFIFFLCCDAKKENEPKGHYIKTLTKGETDIKIVTPFCTKSKISAKEGKKHAGQKTQYILSINFASTSRCYGLSKFILKTNCV